ncbi:MAG: helix-turn-helix domain-containing protein [Subdoligranulum sp.]|jgi:hypothetical protein|nr:helix-turn-helix domain-containing protein [Subdoligranulum sp.]
MEITKAFSLRINELIDETGLSLENLSRAAGVSVFTLFHLKGQSNPKLPSTKVLLKLADYFKCSLSFMLGQEECNSLPSPKTELPAFSDRLRELIEAKELKFFLMKKSGLKKDFPSMYNWLSGKYIPNVYNLVRLAKLLDCSVDYLLGRE